MLYGVDLCPQWKSGVCAALVESASKGSPIERLGKNCLGGVRLIRAESDRMKDN